MEMMIYDCRNDTLLEFSGYTRYVIISVDSCEMYECVRVLVENFFINPVYNPDMCEDILTYILSNDDELVIDTLIEYGYAHNIDIRNSNDAKEYVKLAIDGIRNMDFLKLKKFINEKEVMYIPGDISKAFIYPDNFVAYLYSKATVNNVRSYYGYYGEPGFKR